MGTSHSGEHQTRKLTAASLFRGRHGIKTGRTFVYNGSFAHDAALTVDTGHRPLTIPNLSMQLVDRFARVHNNLRISVTDRCNIRCVYCMPNEDVQFRDQKEILSFEEITRFVRVAARLGVNKLRLTGGEPLVRQDLPSLIRQLRAVPGIEDIALTTNGILLGQQAYELYDAGLQRLNISLDTLNEEVFQEIARRPGLRRVLEGIFAARRAGFKNIRLNALAISDLNEEDILPLVEFARRHDFELRFIEFMPLDAEDNWQRRQVVSGEVIRERLESAYGPLVPVDRHDLSQPAVDFRFSDGRGRIGFINPVTQPFCGNCNRLRLTAEGQIRNCLFSTEEWDARVLLRGGGNDEQLAELVRRAVGAKKAGHGIDSDDFIKPGRAMYQIGG